MATKAAELAIGVTTDASDAVAGFGDIDRAADKMSRSVSDAGDTANETSRKLGLSADAADDMAGKTGKATGALGALAGGLEAVGLEKYSGALQGAAVATDFASGAGDALNLVMESTILKNIRARAATIANAVTTRAAAAATAVMTAGQWALNAAMSANPVGLIVLALVALVAGLTLAWTKSSKFRAIVTGAFDAVKGAATSAFNWVKKNWPLLLAIITGPIGLAVLAVVKNWDSIKNGATAVKTWVVDKFQAIKERLTTIAGNIKDALLAPFTAVKNAVQDIIDLIKKIKLPDIDIPFVRTMGGTSSGGSTSSGGVQVVQVPTTTNSYQFTITGAIDPYAVAEQIKDLLYRYDRSFGRA